MGKDIFGDNYFNKHRDVAEWERDRRTPTKKAASPAEDVAVAQATRKPSFGLFNKQSAVPKSQSKPSSAEMLDDVDMIEGDVFADSSKTEQPQVTRRRAKKKPMANWKKEYIKAVIAGFCGGIVVMIVQAISDQEVSIFTWDGFTNAIVLGLVAIVFLIVFGLIYRLVE